jgi:L-threonylcarbamoyladenylate synthase
MDSWRIRQAARWVTAGGVVAYPTEAVFGLGCDPLDEHAVKKVFALKQRPQEKGMILISDEVERLLPFIRLPDGAAMGRVLASWPGPVSWVFQASPLAPDWLLGNRDSVAVRVTSHPLAAALCRACGMALVSTSANRSGHQPARSIFRLRVQFGERLDYLLCGATGGAIRPSRIQDARTGEVLRSG